MITTTFYSQPGWRLSGDAQAEREALAQEFPHPLITEALGRFGHARQRIPVGVDQTPGVRIFSSLDPCATRQATAPSASYGNTYVL